jgi:hypothetical protein
MTQRYKVMNVENAARPDAQVGDIVYIVQDVYGVAADDTAIEGVEYVCVSERPTGEAFFTIPRSDLQEVTQ